MSENATIAMLFISIAVLIATIVLTARISSRRKKNALESKLHSASIRPFQAFVLGFYLSAFFITLPHWFSFNGGLNPFTKAYSSIVLTFHMVFRLSALNEDFANVIAQTISNPVLNSIYYCYSASVFLTAPLLAMGIILSFFKGLHAVVLYYVRHLNRNIVVMSELNERSLALAKNILKEESDSKGKKSVIVFAGITDNTDATLLECAENIGAICMKKDITLIGLKRINKNISRTLYLIADNEDDNLRKGLEMINLCKEAYNEKKTRILDRKSVV